MEMNVNGIPLIRITFNGIPFLFPFADCINGIPQAVLPPSDVGSYPVLSAMAELIANST